MTDQERKDSRKQMADELSAELRGKMSLEEQMAYLCNKYSEKESDYNHRDFRGETGLFKEELELDVIRERIADLAMYKEGYAYAHEGGGWIKQYE